MKRRKQSLLRQRRQLRQTPQRLTSTADNDSKAVFTGATTVNEGSTALLSVALSGNPNGTRTMNLVSGNPPAAITITTATLTFNASNWNIPQAVLMTGVADANASAETVTITASGVDLGGVTNVTTVDSTVIAIILTQVGQPLQREELLLSMLN